MPVEEIYRSADAQCVLRVCYIRGQIVERKKALSQIKAYAKKYPAVYFSHGLCRKCFELELARIDV